MATIWHAKEAVWELDARGDEATTRERIECLVTEMADRDNSVEVRSLRRTLTRWTEHIVAWYSNGPTEAALIKRVKRAAFSFSSLRNFRVGELLYVGKPEMAPTRDHHIPLKSEAPLNFCSQIGSGSHPMLKFEQALA